MQKSTTNTSNPKTKQADASKKNQIKQYLWLGVGIAMLGICLFSFKSTKGYAPTAASAPFSNLPPNATDVHWFFPGAFGPNKTCSFKTTETAFQQWVKGLGSRMTGPSNGRYFGHTYNGITEQFEYIDIPNTVGYYWSFEDQGESVVYDRDSGIVHYHQHSR